MLETDYEKIRGAIFTVDDAKENVPPIERMLNFKYYLESVLLKIRKSARNGKHQLTISLPNYFVRLWYGINLSKQTIKHELESELRERKFVYNYNVYTEKITIYW